jgi:hypothetical protein
VDRHEATSTILADADRIWAVLTDLGAYGDWDSGVERVEGTLAPGAQLTVHAHGRAFRVKVTELEPGRRMTWRGGLPLGLFTGVRTFTLTPGAGGGTRFHMHEEYGGPLRPLMRRTMPDLQPSFERFARGLKDRVEEAPR